MKQIFAVGIGALLALSSAAQATVIINEHPLQQGSLYICAGCNPNPVLLPYITAAGYIQGDASFARPTGMTQDILSLTPYAQPSWGSQVAVYGFTSNTGHLSMSNATGGKYLGTFTIPMYGRPANTLNVTSFVSQAQSSFVNFDFRSNGTDIFNANLRVAAVPEPSEYALLSVGLLGLAAVSRRKLKAESSAGQAS